MTAQQNIIDMIERIIGLDLISTHQLRACAQRRLQGLVHPQLGGKLFSVCQIHIAERIQHQIRDIRPAAHMCAEMFHIVSRELGNLDINLS